MVGGVGVGELVSVGTEADVDELGSGVGSGFDSQPATAAAQASPARKAVKRPARVRATSNDPLSISTETPPQTGPERPQQLIQG
jgi:hypothetical protein